MKKIFGMDRIKSVFLGLIILFAYVPCGFGQVVVSEPVTVGYGAYSTLIVEISWVAEAGGAVAVTDLAEVYAKLRGRRLREILVIPNTPAPTAGYDIAITEAHGSVNMDVTGGALQDLSATEPAQLLPRFGDVRGGRICLGLWTFRLAGNTVVGAAGKIVLCMGF